MPDTTPTTDPLLRARLAQALDECRTMIPAAQADVVLSVLRRATQPEIKAAFTPARLVLGTTDQQPETTTADRAAVLRVREYLEARLDQVAVDPAEVFNILNRHMADEAQQPETEAWPTETEWIGEVLEDDAWMYLGASPDRSVVEKRRASVTRRHPDAQTRTVRKTTTYTVTADQPDTETEAAE